MLSKFCCCCNVRSGCIVFIWFELMCLVIIISALASPLALFNLRFLSEYYAFLNPVLSMAITTQVIKIVTCISLIWGLIKENHMFYQPWLFVQGTENVLLSIANLCILITGICAFPPVLVLLIPFVFINGLGWYFWASIYAVYIMDTPISPVVTHGDYETLTLTSSVI